MNATSRSSGAVNAPCGFGDAANRAVEAGQFPSAAPVAASRSLVQRTQRAVREQTIALAEGRQRNRRGIGMAALVVSGVLLALTPAVWVGFSWFRDFGSIADADAQSIYILLCLLPVAFMLAIIGWRWRGEHHS